MFNKEKWKDFLVKTIIYINNHWSKNPYFFDMNASGRVTVLSHRTNGIRFYSRNEFLKWYW